MPLFFVANCYILTGYDGTRSLCAPPTLYNAVVRQIMTQHKKSPAELMRALALCNLAMAEAGIVSWYWKYYYNYWRPITAIRYTGSGTHPAAIPQTDWVCLGAPASNESNSEINFTPPFPSYPSGYVFACACFFACVFLLLTSTLQSRNVWRCAVWRASRPVWHR
jgi:hypothetical protein